MKDRVVFRQATAEDIAAFSSMANKPTIRAISMSKAEGGEVLGIAGVAYHEGRWFGFCDMKDEARKYKVHIARAAIRFMADLRRQGVRYIYADSDPNEKTSLRWLTSLGFKPDPISGVYYRWGT
jgi:RimJ/RimL family protein N-acetyltransferase